MLVFHNQLNVFQNFKLDHDVQVSARLSVESLVVLGAEYFGQSGPALSAFTARDFLIKLLKSNFSVFDFET